MRAVIQRVSHASVAVEGKVSGEIKTGLMILLGISDKDTEKEAKYLAEKSTGLRIFSDSDDKMNLSLTDVNGKLLVISQFTLYGDCKKGKRPNFMAAAGGDKAEFLYEFFVSHCRQLGFDVETGIFGADMKVELLNDGPVTLILDTDQMINYEK